MARARKGRQPAHHEDRRIDGMKVYNTGLYVRLSVLDNGKVDSDSIESQIGILEQYVSERPYLRYAKLYQDNGYTGTNFERPAWEHLLSDAQAGTIDCIIVKDLSRLGRSYLDAGMFLEKDCPRLGLRFISVNDGYDSAELNSSEELTAALKNIINDYYAKDISRKACSALASKRQRGDYIGSYAPHGYWKDPKNKNHLVVDPATAPIIRQIYAWRAAGDGYGTILRRLNEQGIPSPGRYRFEHGIVTNNNKKGSALLWNRHVLRDILRDIVYIGHLAQGKCRASLYRGIPAHTTDREEWDVVFNTHEPILSEDLFHAVQAVNERGSAQYHEYYGKCGHLPKETNPYREKLICADCGTQMKLYRSLYKGREKAVHLYICPTYEEHRELACASKKSIRSSKLDETVLAVVRAQLALFSDAEAVLAEMLSRQKDDPAETQRKQSELQRLRQEVERKQNYLSALYLDWKNGTFSYEEYAFAKERYRTEIDTLTQRLREAERRAEGERVHAARAKSWREKISQYYHAQQVTPELVNALVEQIKVSGDGSVTISFRFEDEYQQIVKAIKRLKGDAA